MWLYDIGVIFPSRGLLFTETLKELLDELSGLTHTIYWSHGNTLPECFNKPLKKALNGSHSHILIVEDDMVIKPGILKEMLDLKKDIVTCDYPVFETPSGTVLYDYQDRAIFTGTGFMLIKTEVLEKMPKPIFRSDIQWSFKNRFDKIVFTPEIVNPKTVYGQHDVTFGLYHYLNNEPITITKTKLAQRKLVNRGQSSNNKGADEIVLYDNYKKINFNLIPQDKETSNIEEVFLDGKRMYMNAETAKKLVNEGKAEYGSIHKDDIIVEANINKKAMQALRRLQ